MALYIIKIVNQEGRIKNVQWIRADSFGLARDAARARGDLAVEGGNTVQISDKAVKDDGSNMAEVLEDLRTQRFFGDQESTFALKVVQNAQQFFRTGNTGSEELGSQPLETSGQGDVYGNIDPNLGILENFGEGRLPRAAYRRGARAAGLAPEGTFRSALADAYNPTRAAFGVQGAFRPGEIANTESGFRDFAERILQGGGGAGARSAGASAFDTLQNAITQDAFAGIAPEDLTGEQQLQSDYLNLIQSGAGGLPGAMPAEINATNDALALMRAAAGRKYSNFFAQRFLPGNEQLINRFQESGRPGGFFQSTSRQLGL